MILYHFTSVPLAESCMNSGIYRGRIQWSNKTQHEPVVWLTTDRSWSGHGLLTGSEVLSDEQRRYVERLEGRPVKNRPIANKTEIRISVKIPKSNRNLFAFDKFVKKFGREPDASLYMKSMGLSAIRDPKSLSNEEFKYFAKNAATKEKTWWLYNGVIDPERFTAIQFLTADGYRDYDFETHGRQIFSRAGLISPSSSTLAELSDILPGKRKFDPVAAFCFCGQENDDPTVIIRSAGSERQFGINLKTRGPHIDTNDNDRLLTQWVIKHYDELIDCWSKSVEALQRISI